MKGSSSRLKGMQVEDIFTKEKEYTLGVMKELARAGGGTDSFRDDTKPVRNAIDATRRYLLGRQDERGFWHGELECDCTTTADYIILLNFLGWHEGHSKKKIRKAAAHIRALQQRDGSWNLFYKGPGDISATVKAYFALKLAGFCQNEPCMRSAREYIFNNGGVSRANTFVKFYLALFGQYSWNGVPAMPAELIWLKRRFIYEMSSWTRTIVIPMFLIAACKPIMSLPSDKGIRELFDGKAYRNDVLLPFDRHIFSRKNLFLVLDRILKAVELLPFKPWRNRAIKECERWIVEHLEGSKGLGAIWPAMVNAVMAFKCLGYREDDLLFIKSVTEIEEMVIEEKNTLRVQPCLSPVWDTAITLLALTESGVAPAAVSVKKSGKWILSKEVRKDGDWKIKNKDGKPGGWYFEFANEFYPDIDDSAMVLLALKRLDMEEDEERKAAAVARAISWILSMQNKDGGWAAFDTDNTMELLNAIPFADHNAMLDPASPDITGRVVEALANYGFTLEDAPVKRAVDYLRARQEKDGSWFGRWGVNYIYGTWAVLSGLVKVGISPQESFFRKGVEWLKDHQNRDGGWGESPLSYERKEVKGTGVSTPSQTAWAVLALCAADEFESAEVRKGIDFLVRTQRHDGTWAEHEFTGTGFPQVFYMNYHLYRINFPLLALSRYFYRRAV